ncbi:hypothetical protein SAMN05660649_02174 [Desulfotomaculum arcticum]|uniref:Uncharacterized protein n=1 Tax=Desulfotruncus arcticus DSM 17038 TaxID=1121424 RepID=A0A1I2TJK1_9FIRM|nr:hypothetical protein [Desulfotruncus arcticus]SFG62676.1 hypothetical protein SAMN05660649_02174 [Desulfotomaculum arcticum] [Desulfotruncus arcticus DSM 17038]
MEHIQLIVAVMAFIFAASMIPMAKMKKKGKNVQIWRTITLALLLIAALLTMFFPNLGRQ